MATCYLQNHAKSQIIYRLASQLQMICQTRNKSELHWGGHLSLSTQMLSSLFRDHSYTSANLVLFRLPKEFPVTLQCWLNAAVHCTPPWLQQSWVTRVTSKWEPHPLPCLRLWRFPNLILSDWWGPTCMHSHKGLSEPRSLSQTSLGNDDPGGYADPSEGRKQHRPRASPLSGQLRYS